MLRFCPDACNADRLSMRLGRALALRPRNSAFNRVAWAEPTKSG